MFRSADHCAVLGEIWRRWVIDTFAVAPNRVRVVYNGVPAATASPRTRARDGRFHLLFLGNLHERKGVRDLVRAFARPGLRAHDIVLTMAGGGPVETFRSMAEDLGLADRITFTGWIDQPRARTLMTNVDALILPSYDEGLPLVILEALASGTPVICTPVGSIAEVLEDRRTALFVAPGDEAGIEAAILTLCSRPEIGRELAAQGAALYDRLFTMEAFARSIASLYEALAPRSGTMKPAVWPSVEEGGR
jgi:glycosyltransferase involved in cell wall biosynthesis